MTPLGPGMMAKYEHELATLDGLGLDDIQMDAALTHLLSFVQAWARAAADAKATRRESAMDDERWWAAHAPLLQKVLDPADYPLAARVGTAAGTAHRAAHNPSMPTTSGCRPSSAASPRSSAPPASSRSPDRAHCLGAWQATCRSAEWRASAARSSGVS
jgi:Tetracyclin repressor-like, C-terminal domain